MKELEWSRDLLIGKGSFGTVYENNDSKLATKVFQGFRHGIRELRILRILNDESKLADIIKRHQLNYHSYIYFRGGKFHYHDKSQTQYLILNPNKNLLNEQNSVVINLPKYDYNLTSFHNQIKYMYTQIDYVNFLFQIFLSYYNLYSNFLIHGDIKFGNILVQKVNNKLGLVDYNPVLCDFNITFRHFGKQLRGQYTVEDLDYIQTVSYRSPELIFGCTEFDDSVDLWSIGVLIFKFTSKTTEFFTASNQEQQICCFCRFFGKQAVVDFCNKVGFTGALPDRNYRPQKKKLLESIEDVYLRDLIDKLLVLDPSKRLELADVFSHNYFKSVVKTSNFVFKRPDLKDFLDNYFISHKVDTGYLASVSFDFDRREMISTLVNKFFLLRNLSMLIFSRSLYLFDYLVSICQIPGELKYLLNIIKIIGYSQFGSGDHNSLQHLVSKFDNDIELHYDLLIHIRNELEAPCPLDYLNLFDPNEYVFPHLRQRSGFWDLYVKSVSEIENYDKSYKDVFEELLKHEDNVIHIADNNTINITNKMFLDDLIEN